jgi:hypothetical protein
VDFPPGIIDSLGSTDPRFREWLVGLLALDIGVDLDERHIEGALASISARLGEFGDIHETTAVVRDALLECRQSLVALGRKQQW